MSNLHRMTREAQGTIPTAPPVPPVVPPTVPAVPGAAGGAVAGGFVADALGGIVRGLGTVAGYPYEAVKKQSEIGQEERKKDVATSAYGMSDETYRSLVTHFTGGKDPNTPEGQASMAQFGITPEVIDTIYKTVSTLPANWQNPQHVKAIFGAIDQGLKTGGPAGATRILENMSDFYKKVSGKVSYDPGEMLDILAEYQDPNMDPNLLNFKISSFLDRVSIDPDDQLGFIGASPKAREAYFLRGQFRQILGEMSEMPDMAQLMSASFERQNNAMLQKLFRGERGVSRRYTDPVGRGVETIGNLGEGIAGKANDFNNPAANAVFKALETPVMMGTQLHNIEVPGTSGRMMYNPELRQRMDIGQPRARAASSERRLVRVAQAAPPVTGLARKQMILLQQNLESEAAATGATVTENAWLAPAEQYRKNEVEANIRRAEGMLNFFLQGLKPGNIYDPNTSVSSTEMFSQQAQDMLNQIVANIDELVGVYDKGLAAIKAKATAIEQQPGASTEVIHDQLMQADQTIAAWSDKRREWIQRKLGWQARVAEEIPSLKQKFIETTQTNPLLQKEMLARKQTGGSLGISQAVVASIYDQIRQLRDAQNNLVNTLPPERVQAEWSNLETQIGQLMNQAQDAFGRATGSSVPSDQMMGTSGV